MYLDLMYDFFQIITARRRDFALSERVRSVRSMIQPDRPACSILSSQSVTNMGAIIQSFVTVAL